MVKNLTDEQKNILFKEATESPGTSSLNYEKRLGDYCCVGCDTKLFESSKKYDSGSGWPSFFESLPDVFETKTDYNTGYARTEYHCKKCDYTCSNKYNFNKHLSTTKHKMVTNGNSNGNCEVRNVEFCCGTCGMQQSQDLFQKWITQTSY